MSEIIGNFKITVKDSIKNWWRLNEDSNEFLDRGDGDVDFYSYWYSVCYLISLLNNYQKIFSNIPNNENLVERFLLSRGILFKNSDTLDTLSYLANNWVKEIKLRGTDKIGRGFNSSKEIGETGRQLIGILTDDIKNNSGVGLNSSLEARLAHSINLGKNHEIEFDIIIPSTFVSTSYLFKSTSSITELSLVYNVDHFELSYACVASGVTFNLNLSLNILHKIKVIRKGNNVYLYVDGIFIGKQTLVTNVDYVFNDLCKGNNFYLANIYIKTFDNDWVRLVSYRWVCNEGSGFTINNSDYNFCASLLLAIPSENYWINKGEFNNTEYSGIDGELKRLLEYSGGEFIHELISSSELGLCLGVSSPMSEEANCINLNKVYSKISDKNISKYPLNFSSSIVPFLDSDNKIVYVIPSGVAINYYGININLLTNPDWKTNNNYKPLGAIPFLPLPMFNSSDNIDGYEVSFFIEFDAQISLKFGVAVYDSELNFLSNSSLSYLSDMPSDEFLDTILPTYVGGGLWIRAVYSASKLSSVSPLLNILFGNNLYVSNLVNPKFLVPIIAVKPDSNSIGLTFKLSQIVVRPLSLDISKGVLGGKNYIMSYLKNNSGKLNADVTKIINDKLIPYNCVDKIKYL